AQWVPSLRANKVPVSVITGSAGIDVYEGVSEHVTGRMGEEAGGESADLKAIIAGEAGSQAARPDVRSKIAAASRCAPLFVRIYPSKSRSRVDTHLTGGDVGIRVRPNDPSPVVGGESAQRLQKLRFHRVVADRRQDLSRVVVNAVDRDAPIVDRVGE